MPLIVPFEDRPFFQNGNNADILRLLKKAKIEKAAQLAACLFIVWQKKKIKSCLTPNAVFTDRFVGWILNSKKAEEVSPQHMKYLPDAYRLFLATIDTMRDYFNDPGQVKEFDLTRFAIFQKSFFRYLEQRNGALPTAPTLVPARVKERPLSRKEQEYLSSVKAECAEVFGRADAQPEPPQVVMPSRERKYTRYQAA